MSSCIRHRVVDFLQRTYNGRRNHAPQFLRRRLSTLSETCSNWPAIYLRISGICMTEFLIHVVFEENRCSSLAGVWECTRCRIAAMVMRANRLLRAMDAAVVRGVPCSAPQITMEKTELRWAGSRHAASVLASNGPSRSLGSETIAKWPCSSPIRQVWASS